MTGPSTDQEWRLAEALALEKTHGANAPRFIAERIAALAIMGDYTGVERLHEIATAFEALLAARHHSH